MSSNLDNDRSVSTGKMFPIDLAPQKITIVKSVSNTEVKMAHLIPGQAKTTGSSQLMTHASSGSSMMRPGLAQLIAPNVGSQPQMIVSGSPILQGTQIVNQGSQILSQGSQIITQSPLITPSGQIISPATQIISQGTQLSAQVSSLNSNVSNNTQVSVASSVTGTQLLNVGGQLVSGTGNLMVNSSVRTLPPTVRVLPPLQHHNNRPVQLTSVNVSTPSGVLVNKSVGVTSHVPRGLAAGASLAVRPVAPASVNQQSVGSQGSAWTSRSPRGALVYGGRAPRPPAAQPHAAIVSLPTSSVLSSSTVITGSVRAAAPAPAAAPRPLPLLQRNYQPAKVVGVGSVGPRGVVGNSAPTQLYYEVPRGAIHHTLHTNSQHTNTQHTNTQHSNTQHTNTQHTNTQPHVLTHQQRSYHHQQPSDAQDRSYVPLTHHPQVTQVSLVSALSAQPEPRAAPPARPTILRKREVEPLEARAAGGAYPGPGWGDAGSGGSTTESAASSPARDEPPDLDLSPRKKPRKQVMSNEVRQCEYPSEEAPPTPPPVNVNPPKRPQLTSSYVCGWRATALHFVRPADVRRREPRAKDIIAIASQKHVLSSADGWKVHHLTAQMNDLISLESDAGEQLDNLLRAVEGGSGKAMAALRDNASPILELLKGNRQRSRIIGEGILESREDLLRVFKHRNSVAEILTRQADKRCFRKHRSQS